MAIELSSTERQFLLGQLKLGKVALFCGAGFSKNATNSLGTEPPLAGELAEDLARAAGFAYEGDPLPLVYSAAKGTIGTAQLNAFLRERYDVVAPDAWYELVTQFVWHRIYTTNIDNILEKIYRNDSEQRLRRVVCPAGEFERDVMFEELQCVHLHGHVDDLDKGLTFTLEEFAEQTVSANPWYQALIDDLYNHPVIFVGTLLQESPFYHYVMLREAKDQITRGQHEKRPKSYLIAPNITSIQATNLQRQNIVPIKATGKEFFVWLRAQSATAETTLQAVRLRVYPHHYVPSLGAGRDKVVQYFDPINADALPSTARRLSHSFYLGAEPTWADIKEERDGKRRATERLLDDCDHHENKLLVVTVQGHAGSGKTTIMKRAAYELARQGKLVFYARDEQIVSLDGILALCDSPHLANARIYTFIDNVSQHVPAIFRVQERLEHATNLTLIIAENTNRYARHGYALEPIVKFDVKLGDLERDEVESILARLEHFNFLGALTDKSHEQRVDEFMAPSKSSQQLLVAMKEATKGVGFHQILSEEFTELVYDAKLAYLICCLAVVQGAPGVYRKVLMPSLGKTSFAKTKIIEELLKGVLVAENLTGTLLKPRHQLIAREVVEKIATTALKVEAITNFLRELAPSVNPENIRRRTPAFLAYRGLINSSALSNLFGGDRQIVIGLYEELEPHYKEHFLFWLHYAMAYRDVSLEIAETYLLQADARCHAVGADSFQIQHQMGILHLMQASTTIPPIAAKEKANKAIESLGQLILARGEKDPQTYGGYLEYVLRWYIHAGPLISQKEWEALRRKAEEGKDRHWREEIMVESARKVELAYLMRVVKPDATADRGGIEGTADPNGE